MNKDTDVVRIGSFDTNADPGCLSSFMCAVRELEIAKFLKIEEIPQDEGRVSVVLGNNNILHCRVLEQMLQESFDHGLLQKWRSHFMK